MNSLLGPNYIQGCIRSTAGPVETSAEFPLISPHHPSSPCYPAGGGLHLIEFWMLPPPPHPQTFTPSSVVPYLHQLWTHMWFMMEAGGNVCLLLAVLHVITTRTDRLALHITCNSRRQYVHTSLFVCRVPATFRILVLRTRERRLFELLLNWRNTDRLSWRPAAFTSVPCKPHSHFIFCRPLGNNLRKQSWTCDPFLLWIE